MSLYESNDQDDYTEDDGLTTMVNVSDSPVAVKVASGPGRKPRRTIVQPWPEGRAQFESGYCEPVRGAGSKLLLPIISRKAMKWGIPCLVPLEHAEKARARFLTVSAAKAGQVDTSEGKDAALKAAMAKIALLEAQAKMASAQPSVVQPDDLAAAMTPNVPKAKKPKAKSKGKAKAAKATGAPQG